MLTQKFTGARKDNLDALAGFLAIQNKDDEKAKLAVDALTNEDLENFINSFNGAVDSKVDSKLAKAIATREKNIREEIKKEFETKTAPTEVKKEENKANENVANSGSDELDKRLKALEDNLTKMNALQTFREREEVFSKIIAKAPDAWRSEAMDNFRNRSFDSKEAFEAFCTEKQKAVESVLQAQTNDGLKGYLDPPGLPNANVNGSISPATQAYVKGLKETRKGKV